MDKDIKRLENAYNILTELDNSCLSDFDEDRLWSACDLLIKVIYNLKEFK